ncbi:uncharacterized protein [Ranitomeya imitator]|uniref:uncharacterized protein n=1 Tax=Ranitomeya imitator TaxID=111125 RepID=UPI0037E7A0B6
MDFRAREQCWLGQIEQVFGHDGTGGAPTSSHSGDAIFESMRKMLLKRTKLWWNRMFLEQYLAKKMIPRGLRVQVVPTFPVEDLEFITGWEEACGSCSVVFMRLLIGLNTKTIEGLDKEIDLALSELRSKCSEEQLKSYEMQIDKSIEMTVKKISETQASKLTRDIRDYQTQKVYLWRKSTSQQRQIQRSVSNTSLSSNSTQSDLSTSSALTRSGVSYNRPKNRNYHPYKRYKSRNDETPRGENKKASSQP